MDSEQFLEQVEAVVDRIDVEGASESELRHAIRTISELIETTEEEEEDEDEYEDEDEDEGLEEVEEDEEEDEE